MTTKPPHRPPPLVPGEDYYFNEAGLMVFTAHYLRKRGYCCQSGCRHCPYGEEAGDVTGKSPDGTAED